MAANNAKKKALVVGGTNGIGHGVALALARKGDIQITIAGRNEARGNEIVQHLNQISPNAAPHAFEKVDGFNLKSFDTILANNNNNNTSLDYLIMTQGMATLQGYTPTDADKLDQKLKLHYFSRIYLAQKLAPRMPEGGRILTVLSAGVHSKYQKWQEDFELKEHYSIPNAANAAGFYTDAGFGKLASLHSGLIVAHACPGFVATSWGTEMPWMVRGMIRPLQKMFGRSYEKCGQLLVGGLLDLPANKDGKLKLLDPDGKDITDQPNAIKHTPDEQERIWEKTWELLPE